MKLTKAEKAVMGRIGQKGGKARAKALTATRRVEIAQMGVEARKAKREARS
jgi:hypothetical protein